MPFTMNLEHWQKAVRTTRACLAIALDTQMKHRGVRAKVFSWTISWKWKLMLKASYGTKLQISLIQRMVQWKISTAYTVITAYKVERNKSVQRHCQHEEFVTTYWMFGKNAGNFQLLCLSVSTLGWLKTREWKTRDRKVTLENLKPTRSNEFSV